LILDEATSGLDAANEQLVQAAIDKLVVNRTVLVITHRLATIRKAHVVAVVDHGRIVDQGTHDELMTRPEGLYARLVNKQIEMNGHLAPAAAVDGTNGNSNKLSEVNGQLGDDADLHNHE